MPGRPERRFAAAATLLLAAVSIDIPSLPADPPPVDSKPRLDRHGDPLPPRAITRLGTVRMRGVRGCLAFSPDGKLLAASTGKEGERVILWDAATGREVRQLAGRRRLTRAMFSPDGRRMALSDESDHCRILDADTGKEYFTLDGECGIHSADGKVLVTCQRSPPARIHTWDAATGKRLPAGLSGLYCDPAVAGDGRTVAVTELDDRTLIKVVDLIRGTVLRSFRMAWSGSPQLSLSSDGKTLASTDANGVSWWDMTDGKRIGTRECWSGVNGAIVFSPDGKRLAWTSDDEHWGGLRLWVAERDRGAPRAVGAVIGLRLDTFQTPSFSPDGKRLAVLTDAGAISLRAVADGKELLSFDAPNRPVSHLVFAADSRRVFTRAGDELFDWQTRTGQLLHRQAFIPLRRDVYLSLLSADALLLRERSNTPEQGWFQLPDGWTGEEVMRFGGRIRDGMPFVVAAPGGRFVGVRTPNDELAVLDVRARRCVYRVADANPGLKLSVDGDVLVWYRRAGKGIEVHVRRHAAGKNYVLRNVPQEDACRECLDYYACLSPRGRWLLLPAASGRLRRWDLSTGEEAAPLTEALSSPWTIVWSPDGRFVAVGATTLQPGELPETAKYQLRFWDTTTGTRLRHLTHPDMGMRTCFAPDGRTVATAHHSEAIRLWDVATGQVRLRLRGHLPGGIGSLAFSPDGRMLASAGHDSQALVWDLTGRMSDGGWGTIRNMPEQIRAAWEALASPDAEAAYKAIWQLAADPEGTISFLRTHLRPVARLEAGRVVRLLVALDSTKFEERERAERELADLAEVTAPELRKELTRSTSLEVRRRIKALLEALDGPPRGRKLQALRAVEALEPIGTPAARDLLRELAQGAPEASLTQEARLALLRAEHP